MKDMDQLLNQSPNWYWDKLGYEIVRDGWLRTIIDKSGRVVLDKHQKCTGNLDRYMLELSISRWLYCGAVIDSSFDVWADGLEW